jgi:hypothetical protein
VDVALGVVVGFELPVGFRFEVELVVDKDFFGLMGSFLLDEEHVFNEASESSEMFKLVFSKSGKQKSVSSFGKGTISFSSFIFNFFVFRKELKI